MRIELLQLHTNANVLEVPAGFTVLGVSGPADRVLVVQQLRNLLRGDPSTFRAQVNIAGESFECGPQVSRLIAGAIGQLDPILSAVDVLGELSSPLGPPPISPDTVMIGFESLRCLTRVPIRQLQPDGRAVPRLAEIRATRARIASSVESAGRWALTTLEIEQSIVDLNLDLAARIRKEDPDETSARNALRREARVQLRQVADLLSLDLREQTLEAGLRSWVEAQLNPKRPEPSCELAQLRIRSACQHHRLVANVEGLPLIVDDPLLDTSEALQEHLLGVLSDEAKRGLQIVYVTDRPAQVDALLQRSATLSLS